MAYLKAELASEEKQLLIIVAREVSNQEAWKKAENQKKSDSS